MPVRGQRAIQGLILLSFSIWLMRTHGQALGQIIANPQLSLQDRGHLMLVELMVSPGIDRSEDSIHLDQEASWPSPEALLQAYQDYDLWALNESLSSRVYQLSGETYLPSEGLLAYSQIRAQQLVDYDYFESETPEGAPFYTVFSGLEDAPYRLSEQLYELYISTGDIHLQTWLEPSLLANYLYPYFETSFDFQPQNFSIALSASLQEGSGPEEIFPYIRLIVVLHTDQGPL